MAGSFVEIQGARQLRSTLRRAGQDLTLLKEAHHESAEIVLAEARRRVPVRSGALRDTLRSSGTTTSGIVRAGYKSLPYGGPIHWGWPARNIKPNPFMSDAAAATESEWMAAYEKGIERALAQVRGL